MDKICDIAIIGSGPAGYTSALRFAKSGKKVIVIEKDKIGGTCLNSGCIPTKFLWQAAKTKQKILKSCDYAIKAKLEPVNFEEIILKKNKAIENLSKGVMHLFENSKIDFVNGNASFKTQHQLLVKTEKEEIHITADKIVIASGSKPKPVGNFNFDHKKYIDSTDALNLISVPKNMLIIGAGAIGVEFGSIFASFGCEITLREIMPQILPEEDFELAEEVKKNLLRQGIKVETSSKDPFKDEQMFEKVLIAAGRQSLSDGLNVSNIGLKTDKRNYIVSQAYSTNIENIFAIGDASGNNFLAYTAEQDGISLVSKLSGKYIDKKNDPVPKVVFSFPPAASVKHYDFDKYKNISYGKINFISNARAQIEFEKTGWVKAAVDKDSGKILGIWIIGENADELINTASVIIKAAMTPDDLSKNMFFHPGLSEIIFDACESAAVKNDSL